MSNNSHIDVLLAGAFAAFTVDLLVYPLDTLKTRYQSPDYKRIYYDAASNKVNRNLLFRGLYQGVGSIILITIPSSGAFFTTYEGLKKVIQRANPTLGNSTRPLIPQPVIDSIASSSAELVSCLILTPAEVLKQNAQMIRRPAHASKSSSSPTMQALAHFRRQPSHLFRGYTALAARNLPFTAMQFPMFEHLKVSIRSYRQKHGIETKTMLETAMITASSAGSAGALAAVITTPVDVVKTRIMLAASGDDSEGEARRKADRARERGIPAAKLAEMEGGKKSGLMVAKEVLRENGIKGLFRGGALRGIWTALGSGLYLGVYESGRVWLGGDIKDDERI